MSLTRFMEPKFIALPPMLLLPVAIVGCANAGLLNIDEGVILKRRDNMPVVVSIVFVGCITSSL